MREACIEPGRRRSRRTWGAILACAALSGALDGNGRAAGNVPALFDAYLSRAAATRTAYRTDLRLAAAGASIPPGRFSARSAWLGLFTYRPKKYAELTERERISVLEDPDFRAFLSLARAEADAGGFFPAARPAGPIPAGSEKNPVALALPADEMRLARPLWLELP